MNFSNFLKNYCSTLLFIFFAYIIYTNSNFHSNLIGGNVSINFLNITLEIKHVFYVIIALYVVFLIPLYLKYPDVSKARLVIGYFGRVLKGEGNPSPKEKVAILAWAVKLFFAPLMIVWLTDHIFSLVNNWYGVVQNMAVFQTDFILFFDNYLFWTLFSTILFIDVFFFTIGYLIEMPALKNTIRSVEPTILGWAVCILCYPPLNDFTSNLIGWYSKDFPKFGTPEIHLTMNIVLLLLMGVYARASFALGFKASNLTNRGIVATGPYKYVRHPAYFCKNTAWIIGSFPAIYLAAKNPGVSLMAVLVGTFSWAFIYYLRAMTEESHLSADPEYREYKRKVKSKFIPGLW